MLKWFKAKKPNKVFESTVHSPEALPDQGHPRSRKVEGDEHVREGRYDQAERCYREVADGDAQYPEATVMLGFVLRAQGRLAEARAVLERAVTVAPRDADARYLLGCVLEVEGQESATEHLRRAVELRPDFEQARSQLVLSQQRLSRSLLESDRLEEAEHSYRRELELTPEHFGPHHNLGVVLSRLGRHGEAIDQFRRAISLNAASSASHASLAAAYTELNDSSEENLALARTHYEAAIRLQPNNSELYYFLGIAFWRQFQNDHAVASFDKAVELDPDNVKARWARVMLWAPAFSDESGEGPRRAGFSSELEKFESWWLNSEDPGTLFVGELQPFFLSYQEESNVELFKQYGRICAAVMQRWLERQQLKPNKRPHQGRVRLGIVSADIRKHSVWIALIEGWLRSLDRTRFEIVLFSLSERNDQETAWARSHVDVFIDRQGALRRWVHSIQEQNCEVLLYPALGLDPTTQKLASLRLAPVQMHTWGHPETSGLPTVDYYVSAECFEPADAQNHYSEKLKLLPHLGNRLKALNPDQADLDFVALGIDLKRPILVCPGTPFKYQPQHDRLFASIAKRVPDAQLVFFRHSAKALAHHLQQRVTLAIESAGLNAGDHVRFIRWLSFSEFHTLLRQADVLLDTIGFSGYNTAVQAIECGLPLVTREGRFLRGRLASGVLRRMGLPRLIVQTDAEFVDLVVRLATDKELQASVRADIEKFRSVLFEDETAIGPFQDFLEAVARPALKGLPTQDSKTGG